MSVKIGSGYNFVVNNNLTAKPGGGIVKAIAVYDAADILSYPGSGATWFDISGNGHHGTMHNVIFSNSNNGIMQFNGTNGYVSIGNVIDNSPYTISAVVKRNITTGARNIVSTNESPFWFNGNNLGGGFNNNYLNVYFNIGNNLDWMYVAIVFDGTYLKLYQNGSLVNLQPSYGGYYKSQPTFIGAHSSPGPNDPISFFDGYISSIKIYNIGLTDGQILGDYESMFMAVSSGTTTTTSTTTTSTTTTSTTPIPTTTTTSTTTTTTSTSTTTTTTTPIPTTTTTTSTTTSTTTTTTSTTTTPIPTTTTTTPLPSNLLVYLDAANPSSYSGSGTSWINLQGSANNGVLTNGPTYVSGAISLDGINDYITFTSGAIMKPSTTNGITLIAWIKPRSISSANGIFGKLSNQYGYDGYIAGFNNTGNLYSTTNGTSADRRLNGNNSGTISSGVWKMFTFTTVINNASGSTRGYVNNTMVLAGAHGVDSYNESNFLRVGQGYHGSESFNGLISEFWFYNTQLSDADIGAKFNETKTRYGY
jgi:hypothetical protein